MKILMDAMGGDHAPLAVLRGAIKAKKEYDCSIVLVGDSARIESCANSYKLDLSNIEVMHASRVIGMEDSPLSVRSTPDTSLRVGLTALAQKHADAFVSAGNTGALQMGANLFVRRIPGITRSAIGTMLPGNQPVLLLDCGANATFTPELLCQYALMGSIYMQKVYAVEQPRVGLLNIGVEYHKGTPDHAEAYKLLSNFAAINFIGNIEPTDVLGGNCDVLVADGFSGNVLLKSFEGMSKHLFACVDDALGIGNAAAHTEEQKKLLRRYNGLRARYDAAEYGAAPLIGISAPVLKAHGNSDANAIKNAVRQAIRYAEGRVVAEIAQGLQGYNFRERRN